MDTSTTRLRLQDRRRARGLQYEGRAEALKDTMGGTRLDADAAARRLGVGGRMCANVRWLGPITTTSPAPQWQMPPSIRRCHSHPGSRAAGLLDRRSSRSSELGASEITAPRPRPRAEGIRVVLAAGGLRAMSMAWRHRSDRTRTAHSEDFATTIHPARHVATRAHGAR